MRLLTVRMLAAGAFLLLAGGALANPGVPQTILNIEADHLDCYGSIDEIEEAFAAFAVQVPDRAA